MKNQIACHLSPVVLFLSPKTNSQHPILLDKNNPNQFHLNQKYSQISFIMKETQQEKEGANLCLLFSCACKTGGAMSNAPCSICHENKREPNKHRLRQSISIWIQIQAPLVQFAIKIRENPINMGLGNLFQFGFNLDSI